MILDKRTVLEAAARGYCTPTNSHKELDAELLTAVVDEILRALAAEQPENSQQVGMSRTPETDAIDATADQNYGTDMYRDMLGHARRLEREVAYWKQEFYRVEKMVESEQDRVEELERQLAAAKEAVREACGKICDQRENWWRTRRVSEGIPETHCADEAGNCANEIRALDLSKLGADREGKL